jgi:putative chitinase
MSKSKTPEELAKQYGIPMNYSLNINPAFIESIKKQPKVETPVKVEKPVKVEFDYKKIVIKNPIIVFQENNRLTPDGDIGPVTMRAMRIAWNKTHIQVAHLLGQASHESANFTRLVENTNYSAQGMANTWPTRFAVNPRDKIKQPNALALNLHRNSEAIANNVYANRMGNGSVESGDGSLHRGYGVLQLTGKDNQRKFSEYVKDPAILKYPILIASKYALESAIFFFDRNNLWRFATDTSTDSIDKVSDGVNRGNPYASGYAIGFDERKSETLHFASIKEI